MAEIPAPARRSLRFSSFELDLHTGELRKAGVLVGLQEQSLKVLAELLERPGDLVTRDQLHQRLWPNGTFVDFEHGLNAVINRLREALGDSAESPRFIQTVPRRGYRFIAPLEGAVQASAAVPEPPTSALKERKRRWMVIGGTGIVLAVAAVALLARLWSSPRGSMRTVPLTSLPGNERYPSFSPDGGRIAFAWDGEKRDNEDIYVKVIGTEVPLRLTSNPAADRYPAWSPDGRHISFLRCSPEGGGLFVVPALGGPERQIYWRSASFGICVSGASWSSDGQFLAIADTVESEVTSSIFILSLETLKKRKLTSPPLDAHGDFAPAFSPDGRTIAFNRMGPTGGIYIVPTAGGDPRRVTVEQYDWLERLAWTPTGRELIFSSSGRVESNGGLWSVPASGGTPARLAMGGDNAGNPAVSPTGGRLAYEQRQLDTNIWKIAVPSPTRTAPPPSPLIASTRQEGGPQFSPDGARIAFHSDRTGSFEIWVCDAMGSNLVQLTSFGGPLVGTPRWSPDGRRLAFEVLAGGHSDIHVIDVEGGRPNPVIADPFIEAVASWSADGQWIYFASNRTGRLEVWKAPADGGRAVQITKQGGFAAFESPDGKFVYYSKGVDVGGLWRVAVSGGEETAVLDFPGARLWGYWALVNSGIYFVNSEFSSRPTLQFWSFDAGRVSQVLVLEGRPALDEPGIAISPNGKWLLYTQEDNRGSDIVLVENY